MVAPAQAAISREPRQVGLLSTIWETLIDWRTADEDHDTQGLELVPEADTDAAGDAEADPWLPIQKIELNVDSDGYQMGDVY